MHHCHLTLLATIFWSSLAASAPLPQHNVVQRLDGMEVPDTVQPSALWRTDTAGRPISGALSNYRIANALMVADNERYVREPQIATVYLTF